MIQGTVIKQHGTIDRPDVNYRKLEALNKSMIALFDTDPVKFFEQFKLGRSKKESKSTALSIGDLVDFYLLDCKGDEDIFNERFDEKFALFQGEKGGKQVFMLADELFEVGKQNMSDKGEITRPFDSMFTIAFARVQILGKYKNAKEEKALIDFNDNAFDYYQTLLDNIGKTVIDISLLDKAKRVATLLKEDEFTKDVFSEDDNLEYLPKFPIEWIYITKDNKQIKCKSEIDILKINHKELIINVLDLKTTFDNELFDYNYLKNSYYLQAAFYYLAVKYWAEKNGMEDYHIIPMEFIVGDTSANNRRPIRYTTDIYDLEAGLKGFTHNNQYYRGIHELIEEISWAEDNNMWNISKKVFDAKGILKLNLKYE